MQNSKTFLLVLLGLLSAFGPFVTDMYLPGLPSMTVYFDTTASLVQLGITTAMLGLAFGQVIIGPLSDKYGRKLPLMASLWLFILSTIACIFSWNIGAFIFFRFLQGIAGAGGIVISRSVATDCYSGKELAKAFAMISAVNGLAPILAPIGGGIMLKFTNWLGIFTFLLFIGIVLILLCLKLKESLPAERRITVPAFSSFRNFIPLLGKREFMGYVLIQAFTFGTIFAYISSSPFILQEHYRLSPLAYSLCFAINAVALIIGTASAGRFRNIRKGVVTGVAGSFVLSIFTGVTLWLEMPIIYFEIALFLTLAFGGIVLPTSTALALDTERQNAGTASAIFGAISFLAGGIVSPLVGIGNILHSTAIIMVASSAIALLLVCKKRKLLTQPAKGI
ncbi:MAG: Bcr/CflA family efflux MFS transporter [Odoribacter splanchnicus]|nr:Bcr/CflA family efflux MFS transporter [Odoribacter splanchnicus]